MPAVGIFACSIKSFVEHSCNWPDRTLSILICIDTDRCGSVRFLCWPVFRWARLNRVDTADWSIYQQVKLLLSLEHWFPTACQATLKRRNVKFAALPRYLPRGSGVIYRKHRCTYDFLLITGILSVSASLFFPFF